MKTFLRSKLMDLFCCPSWRTVMSVMLSDWEWAVSSSLELSHRVCERDEVEMFGTSTPQGQAALVLSVGCVGYRWLL